MTRTLAAAVSLVAFTAACSNTAGHVGTAPSATTAAAGGTAIHKIQHVVVIMQENRSFDSYFGTYPGANGLPANVCVPDPVRGGACDAPYHDSADRNGGGPHSANNATADINSGQMNGFVAQAEAGRRGCLNATNPACTNSNEPDVMGWHDAREIPNYWTY